MGRKEDFKKAADDYVEGEPDGAQKIVGQVGFEFGAEHGYQYAQTYPNWISVEDELPPRAERSFIFSDYVLVCDNNGYMETACYNFEKNRWDWLNNVTHWMPIVPPRKEE